MLSSVVFAQMVLTDVTRKPSVFCAICARWWYLQISEEILLPFLRYLRTLVVASSDMKLVRFRMFPLYWQLQKPAFPILESDSNLCDLSWHVSLELDVGNNKKTNYFATQNKQTVGRMSEGLFYMAEPSLAGRLWGWPLRQRRAGKGFLTPCPSVGS